MIIEYLSYTYTMQSQTYISKTYLLCLSEKFVSFHIRKLTFYSFSNQKNPRNSLISTNTRANCSRYNLFAPPKSPRKRFYIFEVYTWFFKSVRRIVLHFGPWLHTLANLILLSNTYHTPMRLEAKLNSPIPPPF